MICFVVPGNIFPVTEDTKLAGKPLIPGPLRSTFLLVQTIFRISSTLCAYQPPRKDCDWKYRLWWNCDKSRGTGLNIQWNLVSQAGCRLSQLISWILNSKIFVMKQKIGKEFYLRKLLKVKRALPQKNQGRHWAYFHPSRVCFWLFLALSHLKHFQLKVDTVGTISKKLPYLQESELITNRSLLNLTMDSRSTQQCLHWTHQQARLQALTLKPIYWMRFSQHQQFHPENDLHQEKKHFLLVGMTSRK